MSLVKFVDFVHDCFGWRNNGDDTQQIVAADNEEVSIPKTPVDVVVGIDVPDTSVATELSSRVDLQMELHIRLRILEQRQEQLEDESDMLKDRQHNLEEENEMLQERLQRVEMENDKLRMDLAVTNARCDKYQSQIISLVEGIRYNEQQQWRRHDVTYSPTYRSESQEVLPAEFNM